MPDLQSIADAGAAAHEKFVAENREIDWAWRAGTLDEWLAEKLTNERRAAESNNDAVTA